MAALLPGAVLVNAVAVSGSTLDPNPDNNRDEEPTHVAGPGTADFSVTKFDALDPVQTGQNITYTVVVTNNGPAAATGVVLTDTLPASVVFVSATPSQGAGCTGTATLTCGLGTIASGGTASVTLVVTTHAPGVVTNGASVTGTETDPNPGNNTTSEPTTVGNPSDADLFVTKTDTPDPVTPGQAITYTLSVGNNGPATASNVVVTDALPAGTAYESVSAPAGWTCPAPVAGVLNCTAAALAPGPPVSIAVAVRVDAGTLSGTTLINSVVVSSPTPDPDLSNNQDNEPTTVLGPTDADLVVVKTDGPYAAVAGTRVSYTLSVTNRGPATATNVIVTDTLPAGATFVSGMTGCSAGSAIVTCDAGSLAPGSSTALGITIATPSAPGVIDDVATVSASEPDPIPSNNSEPEQTTLVARADVAIAETGPASITAGSAVVYTLTMVNNGPSQADNVTVSDLDPARVGVRLERRRLHDGVPMRARCACARGVAVDSTGAMLAAAIGGWLPIELAIPVGVAFMVAFIPLALILLGPLVRLAAIPTAPLAGSRRRVGLPPVAAPADAHGVDLGRAGPGD